MAKAKSETIPGVVFTLNEVGAHVIKAPNSKWGPRLSPGIDEYVQGVIAARFPDGLPKINPNFSRLTRDVNNVLKKDRQFRSAFQKSEVPRETVKRAFLALRTANPQ